jgi:hypothetical protein
MKNTILQPVQYLVVVVVVVVLKKETGRNWVINFILNFNYNLLKVKQNEAAVCSLYKN